MDTFKVLAIAALLIAAFAIGRKSNQSDVKTHENNLIVANKTIDSLMNVRDTLILNKYETKIKYKIKTQKEVQFIYISSDSLQPIIRTKLRQRFINRKGGSRSN